MKTTGMFFCIFLCWSLPVFAQVDTTVWYPLQDGDYWEYTAFIWPSYSVTSIKVIGDTVFPNGKTYKKIEQYQHGENSRYYFYERFEDNKVYVAGSGNIYDSSCASTENKRYDFTLPDSSIWPNCSFYQTGNNTHRFFVGNSRQSIDIFGSSFETAAFRNISINGFDTTWYPLAPDPAGPIAKGVGLTGFGTDPFHLYYLTGAIINGTVYGTITTLNEEKQIPSQYSFEIYPNPSNNEVKISYRITHFEKVTIVLYDVLGNEVMTIADSYQQPGIYNIPIYTHQLSSGVYFASLKTGAIVLSKKLIVLK